MIANHGNNFDVLLYHVRRGRELIKAGLVGTDSVSASEYVAFPHDPSAA